MSDYDSQDAFGLIRSFSRHVAYVRLALSRVGRALEERGIVHDLSKMADDEFAGFSRINAAARINKFGSPEYAENMKRERPTIDLHFKRNPHHPESRSLNEKDGPMDFLSVIEMVCDWWGARAGYDDPRSWADTVELNFTQKGKFLSVEELWLARQVAEFLGRDPDAR